MDVSDMRACLYPCVRACWSVYTAVCSICKPVKHENNNKQYVGLNQTTCYLNLDFEINLPLLLYVDLKKIASVYCRLRHEASACRDRPTRSCRHFRKCRLCRFSNRGHLLTSSQVHRLRLGLSRGST